VLACAQIDARIDARSPCLLGCRPHRSHRYVTQSFSQIFDPEQTRSDLRTLGSPLELPKGWSFHTLELEKPLVLKAKGFATIIQDDLTNTYQPVR
jgi:hypothetical protein